MARAQEHSLRSHWCVARPTGSQRRELCLKDPLPLLHFMCPEALNARPPSTLPRTILLGEPFRCPSISYLLSIFGFWTLGRTIDMRNHRYNDRNPPLPSNRLNTTTALIVRRHRLSLIGIIGGGLTFWPDLPNPEMTPWAIADTRQSGSYTVRDSSADCN